MLCKYQLYVKNFPFSARQVGRSYKCTLGFSFSLNSFGLNIYSNICSIHKSRAKMSLYPMLLPININRVQHAATHFIQTFSKNTFHTNNNYVYQKNKKKTMSIGKTFPKIFLLCLMLMAAAAANGGGPESECCKMRKTCFLEPPKKVISP